MKRLVDFEPWTATALRLMAQETRFTCRPSLASILEKHPKLVVVFSHASPLSWIPAPCLLATHACARGGGRRMPLGIMDRFFFSLPGFRQLASLLTQSDHALNFEETVEHFSALDTGDLAVFPEGSNCFFGKPHEIQDFRSSRFLEIAARAKVPLLICVHRGSENWGMPIALDPSWLEVLRVLPAPIGLWLEQYLRFEERARTSQLMTLPIVPTKMRRFDMLCRLYSPELLVEGRDEASIRESARLESEVVRRLMIDMLSELDEFRAKDGIKPLMIPKLEIREDLRS